MINLKYTKGRIQKCLTFREYLGVMKAEPEAMTACYAAFLWDEETQDYVEFERAREIVLEMTLEDLLGFMIEFSKEVAIVNLFDKDFHG